MILLMTLTAQRHRAYMMMAQMTARLLQVKGESRHSAPMQATPKKVTIAICMEQFFELIIIKTYSCLSVKNSLPWTLGCD